MQGGAADYLVKGQLTSQLLERSVRYSIKHALDMEELKENKTQILQQDRLASLGLLASSLAHEIGTPLGVIRSRAELAGKKIENASLKSDIETIITQIDRITKLVNSLLNLAREKQSDFATAVNLHQVLQDVLNLFQHELNRKSIALQADVSENLFVKAESGPLGQVFLNLLINSVHAIEEAKKQGRLENHVVDISANQKGEWLEISVRDSGCGIAAEHLLQIFRPFFTTKDIGVGTGLGLATSYKLVNSWGGSMTVQSKVGYGTIFTVTLRAPSQF